MDVAELLDRAAESWGEDWVTVVSLLRRALELDPWRADVRASLGLASGSAGDTGEARRQLSLALDLDPDHPKYWADLAMVNLYAGDFRAARSLLEESLVRRPDYVWAYAELTRCYSRLGEEIAMAAAAARTINIDPVGEATSEVRLILVAHRRADLDAGEPQAGSRFPWRRRRAPVRLRPMMPGVDAFLAATALPTEEAVQALEQVLAGVVEGTADYFVVLGALADRNFRIGRHDRCAEYSRRAAVGLPCVEALVAEPRQGWFVEPGRDHDAKAGYEALVWELFDEEPVLTVLVIEPGLPRDVRRATVATRSGTYEIQRGGNLFVIDTPRRNRVIHESFDRSAPSFGEW